ncbi:hypothetical protein [Catenulispora pinisilvae]|uniref:hypothetical protein n=1 Tax=Catenulispora pinisilvae TaxID=2705253 RepID=UPI001890E08B|nr:hypothetical protein [Catenulispora pinisilvae]
MIDELSEHCHEMLLRLAGRIADKALADARSLLAAEGPTAPAPLIARAVADARATLTPEDHALLLRSLAEAGADSAVLDGVATEPGVPAPAFLFAPAPMSVLREIGERVSASLDLTFGSDAMLSGDLTDALDEAAEAAADEIKGLVGLWRTWRFAPDGGDDPAPRRVYLAEVRPDTAPWTAAAELQQVLTAHGETDPQVETFASWRPVPPYQAQARSYSALLWAAAPGRPFNSAKVFDTIDEATGIGAFDQAHPVLEDDERAVVLEYLDAGIALAVTDGRIDDVLDPGRRGSVPLSLRTDGEWIWTDTVRYYLEEHWLAPDPDLLTHIKEQDVAQPDTLDGVVVFRALTHLQRVPAGG